MERFLFWRRRVSPTQDDFTERLPTTIFPSGIKLLCSPEDSTVDIVFVHGLTGDREKTWTAQDAIEPWPKSLLPSRLPMARILTFGYDASVVDLKSVVSENRIANHAWNLLTSLASYRENDNTNERPIVFICHSLGGLVCEDALVTSRQRPEPHLHNILRSTCGIIFLGTPHHGAGLARWAEHISRYIGLMKQTNKNILEVLRRDSEVLARIQDSFHTMVKARATEKEELSVEITCFYEELPLPGIGLVVPQESAILPGYIPIGIRRDHMGMTKFVSPEDPGFVAVCGELRRWVRAISAAEGGRGSTLSNNTSSEEQPSGAVQYGDGNRQYNNLGPGKLTNVNGHLFKADRDQNFTISSQVPIDLLIAHEARYDSADVQGSPKCEEGTRIRIQETITQWADNPSTEPLFWIVGPAGTGKSTIARTVADSFHGKKRLAAGYFFKRGEQGRNNTSRLFPTLAMQLAEADSYFKNCLRKSLDNLGKEAVEKMALEFQFEKLLWDPMTGLPSTDTTQLPRMIIIDALDECECEHPQQLTQVVALLSRLCTVVKVRLRVLLTSRSDPRIVAAFEPFLKSKSVYSMEIHHAFPEDSKADIQTFLKSRFNDIRTKRKLLQDPWPTVEELDRLVYLATSPEPLFIYAATLCRFVYDQKRPTNPKPRLELWLKESEDNKSQLHQIYNPVLSQVFDGDCQELQSLGALVLLATPLSAASFACLLGTDMDNVNWWLQELHAVLDIPADTHGPIRLLHKSFSDFLLSPDGLGVNKSWVDAPERHAMLATKCIQRMQEGLRRDMCDLRKLGASRDDIDQKEIDGHIPADLRYACLYWVYHLQRSGQAMPNDVITFLYKHLLHWLEALSILGRLSDGAIALRTLREIIEDFAKMNSELDDFLKDAIRVIASFGSIIERAPLQTYSSLLLFSPVQSQVRQRLWDQRLPRLPIVHGVQSVWNSHRQTLEGHNGSVNLVAFSCDGQTLASASDDRTVRLWDVATGAQKQRLESHNDSVRSVAFSHDGQTLASASDDGTVQLWDVATGAQKQTLEGHDDWVCSVAFSHDGQILASASYDGTVRLWDVATGAQKQTLKGHTSSVCSVAFSYDSQTLASASQDRTVRLWDVATGAQKQRLEGHDNWVYSVAFSYDGQILASASHDGTVRLWDVATGAQKQTLEGHDGWVFSVAFSHDGQILASASYDGTVRLWDVATGAQKQTLKGHGGSVRSVAFSHDNQTLASASDDRTVRLWDVAIGAQKQMLDGHDDSVCSVAFSHNGQVLASASQDRTVRLWDVATGAQKQKLEGHNDSVRSVAFSHNGQMLASASNDGIVRLWDVVTGAQKQKLEGHDDWVRSVAFSYDGQILASASDDETVRLWDVVTGAQKQILEGHGDLVRSVAFSYDGQMLASASDDETVRLWDVVTGAQKQILEGHDDLVNLVSFSHDGQTLASASYDWTVRLWDVVTGAQKQKLEGFVDFVRSVAFSHDGQTLVSASNDGTVWLWDVATGAREQTLVGFTKSITFNPLSTQIGFGTSDLLSGSIGNGAPTQNEPTIDRIGLSFDKNWIVTGNERMIWLHPEYRPTVSAGRDSMICIGSDSGCVYWFIDL